MAEVSVTMCYFAQTRSLAGCDEEVLRLPDRTTVAEVFAHLGQRHSDLAPVLRCSRLAVRQAFATGDIELADGDELAVIPPVSGG